MPQFPTTDAEIMKLADDIADGVANNPTVFANPPVLPATLRTTNGECATALSEQTQAEAVALAKTTAKKGKFSTLTGQMKSLLRWAEGLPGITEAQLRLIKWGKRAAPTALQKPAQCLDFEIVGLNGREVDFDWKKPRGGGKAAGYKLMKRAPGTASWTLHAVVTRDEAEISDLPNGTWEIAVVAFNDAGDGPTSNAVQITI